MTASLLVSAIKALCLFAQVHAERLPHGRVDITVTLPWWQSLTEKQRFTARWNIAFHTSNVAPETPRRVTIAEPSITGMVGDLAIVVAIVACVGVVIHG